MDFSQFALLGLVQGLTEFLPVSSTGHLILVRSFFGFNPDDGLAVDAVLQLATMLAVVAYFWADLMKLAMSALKFVSGRSVEAGEGRLLSALVVGTIPAVLLGFFLERTMETAFRSTTLVAWTLIAGGVLMAVAEFASRRVKPGAPISDVGIGKGFIVGLFQALALVPGMSRSGMTIAGGLFLGLSRDAAARFGFLLSVPILAGSGLKKLLDLETAGTLSSIGPELLLGCLVAFVSGLAAIHALLLFVRTQPLYPFVIYRFALAAVILFAL